MLANSHRAEQPGESISAPDERFQKCAVELDLLAAVQQNERTGPARIPDGKPAAGRRLPKQGGCQVQLQHDVFGQVLVRDYRGMHRPAEVLSRPSQLQRQLFPGSGLKGEPNLELL